MRADSDQDTFNSSGAQPDMDTVESTDQRDSEATPLLEDKETVSDASNEERSNATTEAASASAADSTTDAISTHRSETAELSEDAHEPLTVTGKNSQNGLSIAVDKLEEACSHHKKVTDVGINKDSDATEITNQDSDRNPAADENNADESECAETEREIAENAKPEKELNSGITADKTDAVAETTTTTATSTSTEETQLHGKIEHGHKNVTADSHQDPSSSTEVQPVEHVPYTDHVEAKDQDGGINKVNDATEITREDSKRNAGADEDNAGESESADAEREIAENESTKPEKELNSGKTVNETDRVDEASIKTQTWASIGELHDKAENYDDPSVDDAILIASSHRDPSGSSEEVQPAEHMDTVNVKDECDRELKYHPGAKEAASDSSNEERNNAITEAGSVSAADTTTDALSAHSSETAELTTDAHHPSNVSRKNTQDKHATSAHKPTEEACSYHVEGTDSGINKDGDATGMIQEDTNRHDEADEDNADESKSAETVHEIAENANPDKELKSSIAINETDKVDEATITTVTSGSTDAAQKHDKAQHYDDPCVNDAIMTADSYQVSSGDENVNKQTVTPDTQEPDKQTVSDASDEQRSKVITEADSTTDAFSTHSSETTELTVDAHEHSTVADKNTQDIHRISADKLSDDAFSYHEKVTDGGINKVSDATGMTNEDTNRHDEADQDNADESEFVEAERESAENAKPDKELNSSITVDKTDAVAETTITTEMQLHDKAEDCVENVNNPAVTADSDQDPSGTSAAQPTAIDYVEVKDQGSSEAKPHLSDKETVSDARNEERNNAIIYASVAAADSTTDAGHTHRSRDHIADLSTKTHAAAAVTEENAPTYGQSTVDSGYEVLCYEELLGYATCPLCSKVVTSIKLLPCMDYCCLHCLQQRLDSKQDSYHEMSCPVCAHMFTVPHQGLENLPTNVYTRAIASDSARQSSRDHHGALSCSACNRNAIAAAAAALKYCKECRQYLCQQCAKVHRKLRVTGTHHVTSNRKCVLVNVDSLMCTEHPTRSLQVFCEDCQVLCCVLCLRRVHYQHNWSDVDTVQQRFRQQLGSDTETVGNAGNRCGEQLQRIEDAEKGIDDIIQATKSEIDTQRTSLIHDIEHEVALWYNVLDEAQKDSLQNLQRNKEQVEKQKKILKCFENFCKMIIDTGTVREVIHVYQSVHDDNADLPLQQVSNDIYIPHLSFSTVRLGDFLPEQFQHIVGLLSVGDSISDISSEYQTWQQLHATLRVAQAQMEQSCQQNCDDQQNIKCLEAQLREKTKHLEAVTKELEEKTLQVEELKRISSELEDHVKDTENTVMALSEQLQQAQSLRDREHQHIEVTQNYDRLLHEQDMMLEKTKQDLQLSEINAAKLSSTVEQLKESLSANFSKQQQMATQLDCAWHQISEQSMIIDHVPPTAVKVCSLRENVTPVYGVTALDLYIFIVRAWSTEIEVYDSRTYCLLGHVSISSLQDVTDMTGCETERCLYLADCNSRAIHTVSTVDTQVTDQWKLTDKPYGVSVSGDCLVVVSFSETSSIGVFSPGGVLQRLITVDGPVVNLRHAVIMGTGQLVICHGSLHRHVGVSIIDAEGHIVKTMPAADTEDSRLAWPTHVAVDQRGFIYVADYGGKRLLQLDADLSYVNDIVDYDQGLRNPRSICVDSVRRRLYVAESGGNVLIFGFSDPSYFASTHCLEGDEHY